MKKMLIGVTAALAISGTAVADEYENQIEVRQAQMTVIGYNMGILGKMAKGQVDYDAAAAGAAATNISMAAALNPLGMWPAGSSMDDADDTKAKAAIWKDMADFDEKLAGFKTASATFADNVGTDLASLRGAIGPLGKTCKGCHSDYKAK